MSLVESVLQHSTHSITIEAIDPRHPDTHPLLVEAAAEARGLYPKLFAAHLPPPSNPPLRDREVYLVARHEGAVVACGALKCLDAHTAELHRMLVTTAMRRRGIGRAMVLALEQQALALGYARLLLGTGKRQRAAISLYVACGWKRAQAFGPYSADEDSVCYAKVLRRALSASAIRSSTDSKPIQNRTSCPL